MSISYQTVSPSASSAQQIPLNFEPRWLYKPEKHGGRFALCHKTHGGGKLTQEIFDVSRLDWVVGQIEKMPEREKRHVWISQATLAPWATTRRISSIVLLNAVWVDIDLAHPPKGFDPLTLPEGGRPEHLAALLAAQMESAGLPEPSYIISTGGGLCAKYLFTDSIPSAARPRWQSLQKHFIGKVAQLGDMGKRWPVDYQACDASRILRLVGSHNPRWNQPCRIVWGNDKRYDFDELADRILPYTREQLREFSAQRALYKDWDDNRAAAAAKGIRKVTATPLRTEDAVQGMMSDELARSLWCGRWEFARAVLEHRGGVEEGSRNNLFWPVANAIAYSCTSGDALTKELASLHQAFFKNDGWTQAQAMHTAASVARRLKEGALYKMRTSTYLDKLEVSASELTTFGSLLGSSRHNKNGRRNEWNTGAMGFEPMRGLSSGAFVAETRRRQALAGSRSAEVRSTTHGADLRAKAVLMRNSGCTQAQIAAQTGASQQTVSRWLRDPK